MSYFQSLQHRFAHQPPLQVQERALSTIPDLCDSVDYAEVSGVLFPKVCVCLVSCDRIPISHFATGFVFNHSYPLSEGRNFKDVLRDGKDTGQTCPHTKTRPPSFEDPDEGACSNGESNHMQLETTS